MNRPDPQSAARWREMQRLFDAALAQPSAVRAAWLATNGTDPALREEVAALLAGDATPDTLLDHPPCAPAGRWAAGSAVHSSSSSRPAAARPRPSRPSSPSSREV